MRINATTRIIGENVVLVPYTHQHVPRYHEWMKSEELQKLTASEPLTLNQEYEMQKSWREDEDKCTFIILDKQKYEQENDEIEAMIGDTNIFLLDTEIKTGEIEIMIAEPSARGKKYGWEAVILMLNYGMNYLHINKFEAKISMTNKVSIRLFKKLKFIEKSRSDVFEEVTLERLIDRDWQSWLQNIYNYKIKECKNSSVFYLVSDTYLQSSYSITS